METPARKLRRSSLRRMSPPGSPDKLPERKRGKLHTTDPGLRAYAIIERLWLEGELQPGDVTCILSEFASFFEPPTTQPTRKELYAA